MYASSAPDMKKGKKCRRASRSLRDARRHAGPRFLKQSIRKTEIRISFFVHMNYRKFEAKAADGGAVTVLYPKANRKVSGFLRWSA